MCVTWLSIHTFHCSFKTYKTIWSNMVWRENLIHGLWLAGKELYLQASSPFSPSYFRARVCELFAQADLQPWSSSLTLSCTRIIGPSHWQLPYTFLEISLISMSKFFLKKHFLCFLFCCQPTETVASIDLLNCWKELVHRCCTIWVTPAIFVCVLSIFKIRSLSIFPSKLQNIMLLIALLHYIK
jgi:hypothetical protein